MDFYDSDKENEIFQIINNNNKDDSENVEDDIPNTSAITPAIKRYLVSVYSKNKQNKFFKLFQNRKRKQYKLTSPIWQHAIKCTIDGKKFIKCNRCSQMYAWHGSSSNMLAHLESKHQIDCESQIDDVDSDLDDSEDEDRDKNKKKQKNNMIVLKR
jgi:hypothetical protein